MNINSATKNELETIWIEIPYLDDKRDQLLELLRAKLKHHFTKEVKFKIIQSTQKLSFYTIMKDHIFKLMQSYVVYRFNCPGCNDSYISEKSSVIYAQEQKDMLVMMKEVPFTTILRTAVITAILKIYSVSIMIHFLKHYLVSSPK